MFTIVKKTIGTSFLLVLLLATFGCTKSNKIVDLPIPEDSEVIPKPPIPSPDIPDVKIVYPSRTYHVYNDNDYLEVHKDLKSSGTQLNRMKIFTADWCSPCMKIRDELLSWEGKYPNNIVFIFVHFDDYNNNPADYKGLDRMKAQNVRPDKKRSIPHLKFLNKDFFGDTIVNSNDLKDLMVGVQ